MDARKTNIQDILEGSKQYLVPLFQRTYDWEKENWKMLWNDLIELYESDEPTSHFFGSFVNTSCGIGSVGVSQFLVIDGQQRLTTLSILLMLLRIKQKKKVMVPSQQKSMILFLSTSIRKEMNISN